MYNKALNKNIPYYLIIAGCFILLKYSYTLAGNDSLAFLLKPTDKLVGCFTGSTSIYINSSGYYHEQLHILIDKSCCGFNFWLLCFVMTGFLSVKYAANGLQKGIAIFLALIAAYLLTIFVNTSRIIASLIIQHQSSNFSNNVQSVIHEATGIITNLLFLMVIYYLTEKLLNSRQQHAKST